MCYIKKQNAIIWRSVSSFIFLLISLYISLRSTDNDKSALLHLLGRKHGLIPAR